MSKPLLKWKDGDARLTDYRLFYFYKRLECYGFAVDTNSGTKRVGEGTAPTESLAKTGAEEALQRYLKANGENLAVAKYTKLIDERAAEIAFVKGKEQE
jgi:hypothetical protein